MSNMLLPLSPWKDSDSMPPTTTKGRIICGCRSTWHRIIFPDSVEDTIRSIESPGNQPCQSGRGILRRNKSSHSPSTTAPEKDEDAAVSQIVVDTHFDEIVPDSASIASDTNLAKERRGSSAIKGKEIDKETEGEEDQEDWDVPTHRWWRAQRKVREWGIKALGPSLWHFFDSSFDSPGKEAAYRRELWYTQKQPAVLACVFFVMSWAATVGLTPPPFEAYDYYAYIGIGGFLTIPILFFAIIDFPSRFCWIWEIWLCAATWIIADLSIIEMHLCGLFGSVNKCGDRSYLGSFGYAYAQPILAVLCLRQTRMWAIIGPIQWLCLVGALLSHEMETPHLFFRNMINFALFHAFLVFISYLKERGARTLFQVRQQLKAQYRATQAAQMQEKDAADSKKRFVSYIFHEVRVPLNTALLAVQNLEGEQVFKGLQEEQAEMAHGLVGSLSMMEKVLNDVLSFNRMESGRFSLARAPFPFHKSIQLVSLSHRIQAQTAGIDLNTELDPAIDDLGMVVGDEMRLRQITSNLVSNAIKFTHEGSVTVVTKLLRPSAGKLSFYQASQKSSTNLIASTPKAKRSTKGDNEKEKDTVTSPSMPDLEKGQIVLEESQRHTSVSREPVALIRVEVHDTGAGLRLGDVAGDRLFSAYVQTEIGRRQGGKGSGLGLALVRQIVKISQGRLGVESKIGEGSMFWFELPYALPNATTDASEALLSPGRRASGSSVAESPLRGMSTDTGTGTRVGLERIQSMNERTTTPEGYRDSDGDDLDPPPLTANHISPSSTLMSASSEDTAAYTLPSVPAAQGDPLSVLVVDDDKLTRMLMSRMIKRLGHAVATAENGELALDLIKRSHSESPGSAVFDVVFLDNQMPRMSGVEVARATRELGCPIYIVGCTGNALREDQDGYLDAGADVILTKPIHQIGVEGAVREARRRIKGETFPRLKETPTKSGELDERKEETG